VQLLWSLINTCLTLHASQTILLTDMDQF